MLGLDNDPITSSFMNFFGKSIENVFSLSRALKLIAMRVQDDDLSSACFAFRNSSNHCVHESLAQEKKNPLLEVEISEQMTH